MKSLQEMANTTVKNDGLGFPRYPEPSTKFRLGGSDSKHLHDWLQYTGYYCATSRSESIWRAIHNSPVKGAIVRGLTGAGKTFMPEKLKEVIPEAELFYFQCQLHTDENDLLQNMIPCEDTVSGIKLQNNVVIQAIEASKHKVAILCIDEYDKSRPSTDTVMLEFLQSGGVHVNNVHYQGNLDNLLIFLCANEERELSDFITRRLSVIFFDKLHPYYVGKALYSAMPSNPYVSHAYAVYKVLYQVTNLPKTITTQEVMQLAKALEREPTANIDALIFQFISKNIVAHKEIINALNKSQLFSTLMPNPDDSPEQNAKQSVEFQRNVERVKGEISEVIAEKPSEMKSAERTLKGIKLKTFRYNLVPDEETVINIDDIGGIVSFSRTAYDAFVKALIEAEIKLQSVDAKVIKLLNDYEIKVVRKGDDCFLVFSKPLSLDDPEFEPFIKSLVAHIQKSDDTLSGEFSFYTNRTIDIEKTLAVLMSVYQENVNIHSAKVDEVLLAIKGFQSKVTPAGFELIGKLDSSESLNTYNAIVDIFNLIKQNNPRQ